jgi:hypothetical protein
MVEHPWSGVVLIFDDGAAKLHRQRLRVASFCLALLPFSQTIMAPTIVEIPA